MDFRTGKIFQLPLVTIGVSSYNYSRYIEEALNSLLKQTYPYVELIIIDDCSTDDCPEKIESWIERNKLRCTYIRHEQNFGITKTSNELVRVAKGKYISLFATDDIMLPEKIERQVTLLEEAGEDYGMCYANVMLMDETGRSLGLYTQNLKPVEENMLEEFVVNGFNFCTPSALIRMDVYKRTGLYDERLLLEDYNFWLRVFARYKAKYCDYPCLVYRMKKQSPILNEWHQNDKERYYRDRIISNFEALSLTRNKKIKVYLQSKITQYLKSLAASDSKYFSEMVSYLLRNRYYKVPIKTFFLKQKQKLFPQTQG